MLTAFFLSLSLERMMKFLNVNQQPAYPFLEAALHGISHRDHQKCRSHFSKCPADTDKFIDQLNTTPGGVQGVLANVAEVVRPPGMDSLRLGYFVI